MTNFTGLEIAGRIATPTDSDWEEARAAWNLAADQQPAAVAFAESAGDVAATVRFAAEHGLRVAPQGTGHGAAPLPSLEDAILLKTVRMRGIELDPSTARARVEAGVLVVELAEAAGAHGLSFMPGSSPDVGVIGYTLGGGLSWLGRRHGFACNRVAAIELIGADGEARTVDSANDADLFWGLRGGGGGCAIVTALHFDLLPIAEVYAGALLFPAELGAGALRAYRDWTEAVPEGVTSIIRYLTPPDLPDVPEPIRGRPLLTIGASCIGSAEEGAAAIAPLRELGEPIIDTFAQIPAAGLCHIHMDPDHPVPGIGDGHLIGTLSDEAIDAFVALAGPDSGSPLLLSELRHLGGALGRPAQEGGALAELGAGFAMYSVGMPMAAGMDEAIRNHLAQIEETMEPWIAGSYFNFTERPCDVDAILPPETCARLAQVKRSWDPSGRILANHTVSLGEV